jgi:predicted ATPase
LIHNELPNGITLRDMKEHRLKGMPELEQLWQIVARDLQQDFPPLKTKVVPPHNLPERLTTFIGRGQEIPQVCNLLHKTATRIVTITGIGGIGKTSLAIQIGSKLLEDFDDGVFFVDLSSLREADLVAPAIAHTFSLHELPDKSLMEVLKEHLSKKKLLLILDNFEQITEAASDLSHLLSASKELKILVTSRELLRLSAEHHFPLAPLAFAENDNAASHADDEAVQLFVERLQTVKPGFNLDREQLDIISEICRQLDGLPLAIELAAARCRMFTPQQLLAQLTHSLHLLTGGARDLPKRHQTMRSAIEWSYGLLSADEKILFQRLAVFVGGCTLDAIQNICGHHGIDVISGIESLLDKQMINGRDAGGESRFWMYKTLREFASEKLDASEEAASLHRKHALYYSFLAAKTDQELDNIRAVFHWSLATGEAEPALRLAYDFFFWEKRVSEGLQLFTQVLALPSAQRKTQERGHALYSASVLSHFHRTYSTARAFGDELMRLGHEIGDNGFVWLYKLVNGLVTTGEGDYKNAYQIFLNARDEADSSFRYALCTLGMASCALGSHNLNDAKQYASESRKILAELNKWNYLIDCDTVLGYTALEENDLAMARGFFRQGIQTAISNSVQQRLGVIFIGLGGIVFREGKFRDAVRWFGISEMVITTTGYYARVFPDAISNVYIAEAKSLLDPKIFQTAWEEGRAMTMEQAIEPALEESS